MRLRGDYQPPPNLGLGRVSAFPDQQTVQEVVASIFEESCVMLELSMESLRKDEESSIFSIGFDRPKPDAKNSGIDDDSGRLTRMLVSARSKEEVYNIISRAYKSLGEALTAAAGGDKKAMEIVRRLNKLIRRSNRKIKDLGKEDDIRNEQKRAEKKRLEQLAQQLKDELKRKTAERKQRERKYLLDPCCHSDKKRLPLPGISGAALEARMQELVQKMQLSTVSVSSSHSEISSNSEAESNSETINIDIEL